MSSTFLNNLAQQPDLALQELRFIYCDIDESATVPVNVQHQQQQQAGGAAAAPVPPPPVPLNIAPGALYPHIRVLTLYNTSFSPRHLTMLLQGIGQQLEVLNLSSNDSNNYVLDLLTDTSLAIPWLFSLRRLTISLGTGWEHISITQHCDFLFKALTRMVRLQQLQLMLTPPGLMDLFIMRFFGFKETATFLSFDNSSC